MSALQKPVGVKIGENVWEKSHTKINISEIGWENYN